MAHKIPSWMPPARLHELRERAKAVKAAGQGKSYAVKPYTHVKGRIIATMDAGKLAELKRDALADLDDRPPLGPALNFFDGRAWMSQAAYEMAAAHDAMIAEAAAAEAEEPEAMAA